MLRIEPVTIQRPDAVIAPHLTAHLEGGEMRCYLTPRLTFVRRSPDRTLVAVASGSSLSIRRVGDGNFKRFRSDSDDAKYRYHAYNVGAWAPDSRHFVTVGDGEKTMLIYDCLSDRFQHTVEQVAQFELAERCTAVTWSDCGLFIAAACGSRISILKVDRRHFSATTSNEAAQPNQLTVCGYFSHGKAAAATAATSSPSSPPASSSSSSALKLLREMDHGSTAGFLKFLLNSSLLLTVPASMGAARVFDIASATEKWNTESVFLETAAGGATDWPRTVAWVDKAERFVFTMHTPTSSSRSDKKLAVLMWELTTGRLITPEPTPFPSDTSPASLDFPRAIAVSDDGCSFAVQHTSEAVVCGSTLFGPMLQSNVNVASEERLPCLTDFSAIPVSFVPDDERNDGTRAFLHRMPNVSHHLIFDPQADCVQDTAGMLRSRGFGTISFFELENVSERGE